MSDTLQDKLQNLDLEFLHGVPVHLNDEMIAQIKQAFEEAGYVNGHDLLTWLLNRNNTKLANGVKQYLDYTAGHNGQPLIPETMTGPEWLDRFKAELDNLNPSMRLEAWNLVFDAARRAAGVSDE
jgi:hypothetical protein